MTQKIFFSNDRTDVRIKVSKNVAELHRTYQGYSFEDK